MRKIKIKVFMKLFLIVLASFLLSVVTYAQGVVIPSDTGLPSGNDLKTVIANFAKWLLAVFGFLAIISFVVSGIIYLTSIGEKERAETAKKAMIYSIVGVIVGLSGYVIIQAIDSWLKGSSNF